MLKTTLSLSISTIKTIMMRYYRHRKILFYTVHPILLLLSSIVWSNGTAGCGHDHQSLIQHMDGVESHTTHRHLNDEGEIEATEIESCGFEEPTPIERLEDKFNMLFWNFQRSTDPDAPAINYTIPAYFHILQINSTDPLVSDSNVDIYMNYLSNAFIASGAPFRFPLMGITRTINATLSNNCRDLQNDYKPVLKRGGKETLNIYVCNSIPLGPNGGSITGYSNLPSNNLGTNDGVTIVRTNPTDLNRPNTLVHEVGHYLGLLHTFIDNCTRTQSGDLVEDTPDHVSMAQTVNCRTPVSTWDTCPTLPGLDPVDNYMTYTVANHECRTKFTTGQVERMKAQFEIYRYIAPPPTKQPTTAPTKQPTKAPTKAPSKLPSLSPATKAPSGTSPRSLSPNSSPFVATPIAVIPVPTPIRTPTLPIQNPPMTTTRNPVLMPIPTPTSPITAPISPIPNPPMTTTRNPVQMPIQTPTSPNTAPIFPIQNPTMTTTSPTRTPTNFPTQFPNVPIPNTTLPPSIYPIPINTSKPTRYPVSLADTAPRCRVLFSLCKSQEDCCSGTCRNFLGIFRKRCSFLTSSRT